MRKPFQIDRGEYEEGAALVEYILIAALVAIVSIAAISNVGKLSSDKLDSVSNLLERSGTTSSIVAKSASNIVSGNNITATISELVAIGDLLRSDPWQSSNYGILIGKKLSITMSDSSNGSVICIGVGHDGEGLTFMMENTIANSIVNNNPVLPGNFGDTILYSSLSENGSIYNLFGDDLLDNITPVSKKVASEYASSREESNIAMLPRQKLWLLSSVEAGLGEYDGMYAAGSNLEGSPYPYFEGNEQRKATGTLAWWWLRSARCNSSSVWMYVYSNGVGNYGNYIGLSGGVRPCFTL